MTQIYSKLVVLLLIVGFISSATLGTYNPTTGSATVTFLKRESDSHQWVYKRLASGTVTIEVVKYDSTAAAGSQLTAVTYSDSTPATDLILRATSADYTCAVVSASGIVDAVKFAASSSLHKSLMTAPVSVASGDIASKKYQIGTNCLALSVDLATYRWDSGNTAYVADAATTWVNPVFNNDFAFAAADDGIYVYTAAVVSPATLGNYAKVTISPTAPTFLANKRIWTSATNILVFSWDTTGTNDIKNYKVHSFKRPVNPATTYTLIGSIEGTFYETVAAASPQISVSPLLKVVVVYGKSSATAFFSKTKILDSDTATVTELTLPAWITETQSVVEVSDSYIYARNVADKAGTTDKFHGAFYIDGTSLNLYMAPVALTAAQKLNWYKSLISIYGSGQLYLFNEKNSIAARAGIVTLEDQVYSADLPVMTFDRKEGVAAAVIDGATGTRYETVPGRPVYFVETKPSASSKHFFYITINGAANNKQTASLTTDDKQAVKALSNNLKCAVVYDSTSGSEALKIYNFFSALGSTVGAARIVSPNLYAGVTLTDASTTFAVSDNCNGLRIKDKLIHWDATANSGAGDYAADTLPANTTLANPVFSDDFSIMVANNGIYYYTPLVNATAGSYALARTDTFGASKVVFRDLNNLVIMAYEQTAVSSVFNYKLQINKISSTAPQNITKLDQKTGQTYSSPQMAISPKLSKIVIEGVDAANNTNIIYVGKSIDWNGKTVKDMTLPIEVTGTMNEIALSEDFMYVRNLDATPRKHYGYALMGSTLVQAFREEIKIPSTGYARSSIIPDSGNLGKLVIAHEYNTASWLKVSKSVRQSLKAILNPNEVPSYDMTFEYGAANSIVRLTPPSFGRWAWTSSTGTVLNWVEYDVTQAGKKKVITQASMSAGVNVIKSVSPNLDCVLTFVTGTVLDTYLVNNTAGTATKTSHWATVTTSDLTATQTNTAAGAVDGVKVGSGCWAFKVADLIYVKPAAPGAYTKLTISGTTLAGAVYDSSLKFAFLSSGGQVYKYTGSNYVSVLNITGLKTVTSLYTNEDASRLLVYSHTVTGSTYDSVIKLFVSADGTTYNPVTIPTIMAAYVTRSGQSKFKFSQSMENIVLGYSSGNATSPTVTISIINVNYTSKTSSSYTFPEMFTTIGASTYFVFEEYLYLTVDNTVVNGPGNEFFYKFDKANLKIVEITKRSISNSEYTKLLGGKLVEQNGTISVLYDTEPATGTVNLVKRGVGSLNLQSTIKNIIPQDAGFLVENGEIRLCPPGCSYCVNPTTCSTCSTGFAMNTLTTTCVRCGPLCTDCAYTDPTVCLASSCVNGHYESSGSCLRCHESCVTCTSSSATTCLSCKLGYYLESGVCTACIDNCVKCTSGATDACDTCKMGHVYHSASKTCVKCIAGCTVCSPTQIYSCVSCGSGFEAITLNGTITECKQCPQRCKTCQNGTCSECRPGFRLINNNCTEQCQLPCKDCTQTSAKKCTSCIGGYTFANETCTPDLTCNSDKSCTSCPIGYNLAAGECKQCNGGTNCRTCENGNTDKCASCVRGYYLTDTSTCAVCNITGCQSCENSVYCNQCRAGYILSGTVTSAKCTKCADSCATCFDSPNNCETCSAGYTRKGWNCVNNNNIKLGLVLAGNFTALTTEQYVAIEDALCELAGKDKNQISIDSLKSSSILLDTTINVDNTAQQSSLISSLQTSLATGSSLGGFTIETSALTAVSIDGSTTSSDDAKKYRDIAIIVGIVIPIGLIIIFILFFILYKKGVICSDGSSRVQDRSIEHISIQNLKGSEMNTMRVKN